MKSEEAQRGSSSAVPGQGASSVESTGSMAVCCF